MGQIIQGLLIKPYGVWILALYPKNQNVLLVHLQKTVLHLTKIKSIAARKNKENQN